MHIIHRVINNGQTRLNTGFYTKNGKICVDTETKIRRL